MMPLSHEIAISHRRIGREFPPLIIAELSGRLGVPMKYNSPAEIMQEIASPPRKAVRNDSSIK